MRVVLSPSRKSKKLRVKSLVSTDLRTVAGWQDGMRVVLSPSRKSKKLRVKSSVSTLRWLIC